MCGIAGTVNSNFSYQQVIKDMGHRGPDEHDGYKNKNVTFFHLRLQVGKYCLTIVNFFPAQKWYGLRVE